MAMTETTFEIDTRGHSGTRPAHVVLEHGRFERACELCGATPTALCVHRNELDPDTVRQLGDPLFVERYYYCAAHRSAAAALYDDFHDAA